MDFSTHTDTHLYEQQQQQQIASQAYDPSQIQPYYTYPHQYDQQQQASQQHYPYYPTDYTNIYNQAQHHEPTSIHPPGVPIQPETTTHLLASEYGQTHLQNQQNSYYPQGLIEQQHQQLSNSDSAAAAFQQWQGNGGGYGVMSVHDGSGSMPQPISQSPYRGGRRGGKPFRGGGWSHGGFRPDGSGPRFRGRGRGRRGDRFAPSEGIAAGEAPSASGPGQAPFWPPPRMAWCELCRVDCNTLEILEQHKNGKKHKKNLQVYEELQNLNKLITAVQNHQVPVYELKPEGVIQPEKVEGEKHAPPENLPSEAAAGDDRSEGGLQKDSMEKSEMAELTEEPERKPRVDHFEARGRGSKRTMRGGRGGKRIRTTEGPRRPVEPPKPKQVIPFICELCNVKCDSQVVFDSHLAGKKHLTNFKRYQGYQAVLGAVVLQALCQPNPNAPSTSFIPQAHQQGIHDPRGFSSQPVPYMLPQAQALAAAPLPAAPVPVFETQDQQDSKLQGSQAILEAGNQNSVTVEAKSQLKSVEVEVKSSSAMSNDTKTEKEASLRLDNSAVALSETVVKGPEQVLSATVTVDSKIEEPGVDE